MKNNAYTPHNDSINYVLRQIRKYAPLSAEEELSLVLSAKNGNAKAKDRLMGSHLAYVFSVAKKYHTSHAVLYDLYMAGCEGMLKAFEKFNPDMGFRFLTYASFAIEQSIQTHLKKDRLVPNSSKNASDGDEHENSYGVVALDEELWEDGSETGIDRLEGDVEYEADYELSQKSDVEYVMALVGAMPAKNATVTRVYGGMEGDGDVAMETVAAQVGVCRERARQIYNESVAYLQQQMECERKRGDLPINNNLPAA